MASKRSRRNVSQQDEEQQEEEMTEYEKKRQQRIKENKERLEKMGILDLAKNLKPAPKPNKKPLKPAAAPADLTSTRRSSRLTGAERVDYSEKSLKGADYVLIPAPERERRGSLRGPGSRKGRKHSEDEEICIKESSIPEVYTEEHGRLLGDCKMVWILDVDGYDEDGHRIYDQYEGKHCHQCSSLFCYQTKMQCCHLDNVKKQGFKSVAHYLIETRMEHKIKDPNQKDVLEAVADKEFERIDGEVRSDHNSVLEISDDNKQGGMDEDYDATDSHESSGDESEE
uniref:Zinc-finger domain-containing protein n=1 Tax=Daucus carota subsp. sativus TaxID=79200 RepID=A0A166IBZ4_DAUCS